jgi:hypothetical protein
MRYRALFFIFAHFAYAFFMVLELPEQNSLINICIFHYRTKAFVLLTILTVVSALFYVIETSGSEMAALGARLGFATIHILFMATYALAVYYHGSLKDAQG